MCSDAWMSRLSYFTEDVLTDAQRQVWDDVIGSRRGSGDRPGGGLINDQGGLIGPFNALLYSPEIGRRAAALGEGLRFGSSLDNRLLELAVITIGAHWRSNFEFFAHSRMALDAGVSSEVVDAIAGGSHPEFEHDDERTVYALVRSLIDTQRVSDELYSEAVDLLSESGLVEVVLLVGYYTMISLTLNTFEIAVPEPAQPTWPD